MRTGCISKLWIKMVSSSRNLWIVQSASVLTSLHHHSAPIRSKLGELLTKYSRSKRGNDSGGSLHDFLYGA